MSNLDINVTFNNGIGTVDADAFKENLPEGITLETFQAVDDYRDTFVAGVASVLADEVQAGDRETDHAIAQFGVGGNTTVEMLQNRENGLVVHTSRAHSAALAAVIDRATAMYMEDASVVSEDDDE